LLGVSRLDHARARHAVTTHRYDYVGSYVDDLGSIVDMDVVRSCGLRIGVDPLGGASLAYWKPIIDRYGVEVQNGDPAREPSFGFMTLDWDGKIRMDCSSAYAMAPLVALKGRFDVAFGNDPDSDRHGIVTRTGLMNPNHYLAAAIFYLFTHRPDWSPA